MHAGSPNPAAFDEPDRHTGGAVQASRTRTRWARITILAIVAAALLGAAFQRPAARAYAQLSSTDTMSTAAGDDQASASYTIPQPDAADGEAAVTPDTSLAAEHAAARRVVAYFPLWLRNSGYSENDIDFSVVTHVAHFSVSPRADGTIDVPDWGPFPDPRLIAKAHAAGAKVVLTVGGDHAAATQAFAAMTASTAARRAFVKNLTDLIAANGYDGVDLDWEFPQSAADRAGLTALVKDLRAALDNGKSLSIAAPASDWYGRWFDIPAMLPYLDWIGAMTYSLTAASWSDHSGHNAALYSPPAASSGPAAGDVAVDTTRAYYLSRGVPAAKLLIGLPFFGQKFDGATAMYQSLTSSTGEALDYRDIEPLVGHGWSARRDDTADVPYLVRSGTAGVISYDDPASIADKCNYVVQNGLGGAIIWHLGKDRLGAAQPLLNAARRCR